MTAVIVHNTGTSRPDALTGATGFLWWSATLSHKLTRCNCGWRPNDPPHYRLVPTAANFDALGQFKAAKHDLRQQAGSPASSD